MTPESLLAFEAEMVTLFEEGLIRSPLHLAGGNEQSLIDIFKCIDLENDWVCGGWRMHYHCLLKGVPADELKMAIIKGRSIALCFPEHKIISSAIVGGIAPIAMGIAWGLKNSGKPGKVWVFIGDMTARTGIVGETLQYVMGHQLPLQFVVEDNGKSVCTPTQEVWGHPIIPACSSPVMSYNYELTVPHVGIGKHISF